MGFYACTIRAILSRTSASGTTLVMPPCFCVERLAAQQANVVIAVSSFFVKSAGALFNFRKQLIALPPKISPAPVVSTTWISAGEAISPVQFRFAK